MIPPDFPPFEMDDDAERRRILAKVYDLLIRLAEEVEDPHDSSQAIETEERGNPESAPEGPRVDVVSPGINLRTSPESTGQRDLPAP